MSLEIHGKQPLPAPWQQLTEQSCSGGSDAAHHSVFPKGMWLLSLTL